MLQGNPSVNIPVSNLVLFHYNKIKENKVLDCQFSTNNTKRLLINK